VPPHLYRTRGLAYEAIGEFELSRADHESAIASAQEREDRGAEWQARLDLGMLWASRDYERTGEQLTLAHELASAMGDESLIAHTLNRIGNWMVNTEQPVAAVEHHQQALEIFRRLGDAPGTADSLDLASMAYGLSGDNPAALEYAAAAVEIFRELDDRQRLAGLLATFGFYSHGLEKPNVA
jgi:tetratricopeptide (TPR) repeat protein